MALLTLPNGKLIEQHNAIETMHLYREIFEHSVYLGGNISLAPDAVVVDAGANIGLFTLFVLDRSQAATIYAIEPAVKTYSLLTANTTAFRDQVSTYNCGLGGADGYREFTFFPRVSCGSGFYDEADISRRKEMVHAFLKSDRERYVQLERNQEALNRILSFERSSVKIVPLSHIIQHDSISRIDLLKIDVEGSELGVLEGIQADHWDRVKQVAVEVHDHEERLSRVVEILEAKSFEVATVREWMNDIPGITMVYATKK